MTEPSRPEEKRGGPRKIQTWQEKLALADPEVVRQFLCGVSCSCQYNCLWKVLNLGEQGVQVVVDLREARFAGK